MLLAAAGSQRQGPKPENQIFPSFPDPAVSISEWSSLSCCPFYSDYKRHDSPKEGFKINTKSTQHKKFKDYRTERKTIPVQLLCPRGEAGDQSEACVGPLSLERHERSLLRMRWFSLTMLST